MTVVLALIKFKKHNYLAQAHITLTSLTLTSLLVRRTSEIELAGSWCSWSLAFNVADVLTTSFLLLISLEVGLLILQLSSFDHIILSLIKVSALIWSILITAIVKAIVILSLSPSCLFLFPISRDGPFTFFKIVSFQANRPPRLTTLQNLLGGFWGSCLPMAKLSKISENLFEKSGKSLEKSNLFPRWPKPSDPKVQLASIFFLGLQAYSFDFRSCTLSLEEFLRVSCGYPGSSRKYLNLLFWHFFARKCNTCDHLNCYNLPLNMHQVFDLSKRHLPNISCCFIYHLICL